MTWQHYYDLEPIRRLKNEGRELLGRTIILTEKRDGENVSLWVDEGDKIHVSSHNLEDASEDIKSRLMLTPEFHGASTLLSCELVDYKHKYILYGELLKQVSPTRIEPRRKHIHWILFDVWDLDENRYLSYNQLYMLGYHYKIPVVREVLSFKPMTMNNLSETVKLGLSWCKKHKKEGIVGKAYDGEQCFFKEKVDVPKRNFVKEDSSSKPVYPLMPDERVLRALQHAWDEIGGTLEAWRDKSKAMPMIAKHMNLEAREHNFSVPHSLYQIYLDTPWERIAGERK